MAHSCPSSGEHLMEDQVFNAIHARHGLWFPWWRNRLMLQSTCGPAQSASDGRTGLFDNWTNTQDNEQHWEKQQWWTTLPPPPGRKGEQQAWLCPLSLCQISIILCCKQAMSSSQNALPLWEPSMGLKEIVNQRHINFYLYQSQRQRILSLTTFSQKRGTQKTKQLSNPPWKLWESENWET